MTHKQWCKEHPTYYKDYYRKHKKKIDARYKKWTKQHSEQITEYEKRRKQKYVSVKRLDSEMPSKQPAYKMWQHARRRAKLKGLECTITVWDIRIPEVCPYLGIPLKQNGGRWEYHPSLDRIDNSKGYTPDNIRVISRKANTMKNDASVERLLLFAKNIIALHS